MPYKRPTLSALRTRNKNYVQTNIKDVGTLLRFANLAILADADAGMAYLHYGYLDYIAKQATPFTATDEWLAGWGGLKSTARKAATAATCAQYQFTGTTGNSISAGAVLNRSDGYQYTVDSAVSIDSTGTAIASITAVLPDPTTDSTGGGASGNADAGTVLTLDQEISGVQSTGTALVAIGGGSDIESQDEYRSRVLLAYQNTPQGGNSADYKEWALAVSGVTRAWVFPRLQGAGTVGVYIMTDGNNTSNDNGFPSGTSGVSSYDTQVTTVATGVPLTVANALYVERPVTAEVYVCVPIKTPVNFVIGGLSSASSAVTSAIKSAIDSVFFEKGAPGGVQLDDMTTAGTIYLSDILSAITGVDGTEGLILTSPTADIKMTTGCMPVTGTITYT